MEKRYNNYTLAIISALISGSILGIMLLLLQQIALGIMPEWLFDLLFLPLFTNQAMAGIGYIHRWLDILLKEHTLFQLWKLSWRKLITLDTYKEIGRHLLGKNLGEFVGLTLGIALGIALTILQAAFNINLPVTLLKPGLGFIVLGILNIARISGLLGRSGKVFDYVRNHQDWQLNWASVKSFLARENINYNLSIIGGLVAGIIFTSIVVGLMAGTSALSFGTAPVALGCAVFALSTICSATSASSYIGRCVDIVFGNRSLLYPFALQPKPTPNAISRRYEKTFTLIGVALCFFIAIGLIAGGITAMPFFGSGLPPLISGILMTLFLISAGGGFGNRLGHAIDRFLKKPLEPPSNSKEKQEHETMPQPERPPSPSFIRKILSFTGYLTLKKSIINKQENTHTSTISLVSSTPSRAIPIYYARYHAAFFNENQVPAAILDQIPMPGLPIFPPKL